MRHVDFVVYTSKLCNLRCSYCYELPLLGDKRRITGAQASKLFANVRHYLDGRGAPASVRFQWHGGEPLLIPPDFYWSLFERCRETFDGSPHVVHHTVQSNFTVLDEDRLDLLINGFDAVGVSLDLHSGLRVNKLGVDQEHRTLANLDRALEAGLRPEGITVLSGATVDRVPEIYRFYRDRGMNFRLLPLERGLYETSSSFEVSPDRIVAALCEAADLWFEDDRSVRVEPIAQHLRQLVAARANPDARVLHDKLAWESVLEVDTNGKVLGHTTLLDDTRTLGNAFDTPLEEIFGGPAHVERARNAQARVDATCKGCRFLGQGCSSHPIAESEASFLNVLDDGALECSVVLPLLDHLERRLVEAGAFHADGAITPGMRAALGVESPALRGA